MKKYLFVYSDNLGGREYVNSILNKLNCNWRYDINNCYYLKSDLSAEELSKSILKYAKGRFFITEITSNRQGMLPSRTWEFLNNK